MPVLFKNDPTLKEDLVRRAVEHRKADRFRQAFGYFGPSKERTWGRCGEMLDTAAGASGEWRGCAIGCLATPLQSSRFRILQLHSEPSARLRRRYRITPMLSRLAEAVFEEAWNGESASTESQHKSAFWPQSFAEALPVGIEVSEEDAKAFATRSRAFYWDAEYDELEVRTTARGAATSLTRWLRSLSTKGDK